METEFLAVFCVCVCVCVLIFFLSESIWLYYLVTIKSIIKDQYPESTFDREIKFC